MFYLRICMENKMRINDYFNEIVNNAYLFVKKDLDILKDKLTETEIKQLDSFLQEARTLRIRSVTEKHLLGGKIQPHDYMSCSIYHWPNPDTENGLPYIERDGIDNPEALHGDKESLRTVSYITYLSALLYYVTRQKRYLDLLVKVNRFWFLDPETAMNPNLRYAQCIPGVNDGEPGGIIDYAASYVYALNLLRILHSEAMLPQKFYEQMKNWHLSFLDWLIQSDQGKEISQRNNNQGPLYDLLLLVISVFVGKEDSLASFDVKLRQRIHLQISNEGMLPNEMHRTKTESYTTMALKMMLESARLLQEYGFSYQNEIQLEKAFGFVKPRYLKHEWEFRQIKEFDSYRGYYILFLFQEVLHRKITIDFEVKKDHWGYICLTKLTGGKKE